MKVFLKFLINFIITPDKTFKIFLNNAKKNKYSAILLLVLEALFILTIIGYTASDVKLFFINFLRIPIDKQNFWDIFLAFPVTILSLILITGVIHLSSRIFKSSGNFENIFILTLISVVLPFYIIWFFDTIVLLLYNIFKFNPGSIFYNFLSDDFKRGLLNLIYMIPCLIWNTYLIFISIIIVERIKKTKAIFISLLSVILFWGIIFVILL